MNELELADAVRRMAAIFERTAWLEKAIAENVPPRSATL